MLNRRPFSLATLMVTLLTSVICVTACGPTQGATTGTHTETENCDLYTEFKKISSETKKPYRYSFETPSNEPSAQFVENSGTYTVTVQAGLAVFNKGAQTQSMRYLDFDTNTFLPISDKEAISSNKDWDIGIRGFELYTNGGPYPGDIEVAKADASDYDRLTKADAERLSYLVEKPVDSSCTPIMLGYANYLLLSSAPDLLNPGDPDHQNPFGDHFWFTISPSDIRPNPKPFVYILRSRSKGWMYKFQVVSSVNSADNTVTFNLKYTKLP